MCLFRSPHVRIAIKSSTFGLKISLPVTLDGKSFFNTTISYTIRYTDLVGRRIIYVKFKRVDPIGCPTTTYCTRIHTFIASHSMVGRVKSALEVGTP